MQHCGFSRANALEIRPSYTKPLISARMYADTKVYILNEIRFRLIFNPEENMYVVMCSMGENIMDGCGFPVQNIISLQETNLESRLT